MNLTGQSAKQSQNVQARQNCQNDQSAFSSKANKSAAGPAYFSFESHNSITSYEDRQREERRLKSQREKLRIDELIQKYYLEGELTDKDLEVR